MTSSADQIEAMRALYTPRTIRDVLRDMPDMQRFRERLDDPAFPTPEEVALATAALAVHREERQAELALSHAE